MKQFHGKVALVTGASSGIGETIAAQLVAAGATVFGVARRQAGIDAARARHPEVHWLRADVADAVAIEAAVQAAVREAGTLDLLVNNAAIFEVGPLEASDDAMVRRQFEANVYGTISATRAALPALKASRGSVINLGSAAGHKAMPNASIYAATKATIESLTKSWALELAPDGVRVNAIAPGPTETPVFEKEGMTPEQVAGMKAAFVAHVPLGRMASTEELARWVLHLADPAVTWVTGHVFAIDGGMSLG